MSRVLQSFWPIVSLKADLWHNRDFCTQTLGFSFVIWRQQGFDFTASFELRAKPVGSNLCHGFPVVLRFRIRPSRWTTVREGSVSTDLKENYPWVTPPPSQTPRGRRPRPDTKDQFPDGKSRTEPLCRRTGREGERERKRETDGWKSCEALGAFCWLEQEEVDSLNP